MCVFGVFVCLVIRGHRPDSPKYHKKNRENEIAIYFANAFWSRLEKSRNSDPSDLRQVCSRLSAVAFFTFLLSPEKVTNKCHKNTQNCYLGP